MRDLLDVVRAKRTLADKAKDMTGDEIAADLSKLAKGLEEYLDEAEQDLLDGTATTEEEENACMALAEEMGRRYAAGELSTTRRRTSQRTTFRCFAHGDKQGGEAGMNRPAVLRQAYGQRLGGLAMAGGRGVGSGM